MENIKEFLEADALRTQGVWESGVHPANGNINIVKPIFFGNRGGKLPECEGSHLYLKSEPDARFIAAASLISEEIRAIQDAFEQVCAALDRIKTHAAATNNIIERKCKTYEICQKALALAAPFRKTGV